MRKCPYCGEPVQENSTLCGFCGKEVGISGSPVSGFAATGSGAGIRNCVACGRPIHFEANVCPYCGHDYRMPMGAVQQVKKTWMPVLGGVLIVVAGILALAMGALYLSLDAADFEDLGVALPPEVTAEDVEGMLQTCGVVLFVFAIIAIVGGIFGIRRKRFALAVAGGIFGLLGLGFVVGSILGLVGLILVVISRKEFE